MDNITKQEILGLSIKKEREKQGLTQEQLAIKIGINVNSLSRIETGAYFPTLANFCNIVEVLKIEPNYFLGSFHQFNEVEESSIDKELYGNLKTLSDEAKIKINELVKILRKDNSK